MSLIWDHPVVAGETGVERMFRLNKEVVQLRYRGLDGADELIRRNSDHRAATQRAYEMRTGRAAQAIPLDSALTAMVLVNSAREAVGVTHYLQAQALLLAACEELELVARAGLSEREGE